VEAVVAHLQHDKQQQQSRVLTPAGQHNTALACSVVRALLRIGHDSTTQGYPFLLIFWVVVTLTA
jgi:hypothetical protein